MYSQVKLQQGDRVALIAPSGSIASAERVDYAVEYFKKLGLIPVEGANCRNIYGHLAGTDDQRAADFNWAFADESIKAVFCIRGGNGAAKILDKINFEQIKKNPKCFYGYSDISVLHAAINQKTGLITYHTPMASEPNFAEADAYTLAQFEQYIFEPRRTGPIETPDDWTPDVLNTTFLKATPGGQPPQFLNKGTAEGLLCGGNLAAISGTMGTPYEIDTRGKIFFIEEVGQRPPHIDRRLNAFKLAGKFDECAGVIFGGFTNCKASDKYSLDIPTIIHNLGLKVPVIWNFPCGHDLPTASLPLGAKVRMDSKIGVLVL